MLYICIYYILLYEPCQTNVKKRLLTKKKLKKKSPEDPELFSI
jgi:hypothetical protein